MKYALLLLLCACSPAVANNEPDAEVAQLREVLEPVGLTVYRIDPTNPEHQRRYARHLATLSKKETVGWLGGNE
jgi:hypothetical protein